MTNEVRKRCCCNCDHRMVDKDHCDIDGHYIGYLECFYDWCRKWKGKKYKKMFREERHGVADQKENALCQIKALAEA